MENLSKAKGFNTYSGYIEFINPDQFLSKIQTKVIKPNPTGLLDVMFQFDFDPNRLADYGNLVPKDMTLRRKTFRLKPTKNSPVWHSFSRIFDKIYGNVHAPFIYSIEADTQIYRMVENFMNPKYAIRINDLTYLPFDPDNFIYYITSDGKYAELVNARSHRLISISLDKVTDKGIHSDPNGFKKIIGTT